MGIDPLERQAIAEFYRRVRRCVQAYKGQLEMIPATPLATNAKYAFSIDGAMLQSLLSTAGGIVDSVMLQGGPERTWFFEQYVRVAYQRGTAKQFANIAQQSPVYKAGKVSLANLLASEPYARRTALLAAREFEEMQGIGGQIKADMGRILTDGIARGLNPLDIARNLTEQTKIENFRARRIARTEVGTALNRARLDEADDALERYNIVTKEMQVSALSPTTRRTHAARHGKLYTTDEMREWWSVDANSINCYLPGTVVQGRFIAGSKSFYRGPAVKLVTTSGATLTVTPNHPVLTREGLRAAGQIAKGDDLVRHSVEVENSIRVGALHDEQPPALIEDVFAALSQIGHTVSTRVRAVDFHGDAVWMCGDIDVVHADRMLPIGGDAVLGQVLDHLALKHADSVRAVAHHEGTFELGRWRVLCPASSLVGGERLRDPAGRVALQGSELSISGFDTVLEQNPSNDLARDAEISSDGLLAAPRGVCFDHVVGVERFVFEGHVYDLQEISGLMSANSLIASNCKCTAVSVMVDDDGKPLVESIVDRALANKRRYEEKYGDE